jgi:hypothetical protein
MKEENFDFAFLWRFFIAMALLASFLAYVFYLKEVSENKLKAGFKIIKGTINGADKQPKGVVRFSYRYGVGEAEYNDNFYNIFDTIKYNTNFISAPILVIYAVDDPSNNRPLTSEKDFQKYGLVMPDSLKSLYIELSNR